jgi:hypothetical protein
MIWYEKAWSDAVWHGMGKCETIRDGMGWDGIV